MVFKVKKKAEKSYFNATANAQDDSRFTFKFDVGQKEPEYNYNWPYDFFSLVELAQVETNITLKAKDNSVLQGTLSGPGLTITI